MRIGIDARFLGRTTGIGRYISELFMAMAEQSDDEFVLFLRKDNWNEVPETARVKKVLADVQWYTLAEQIKLPAVFDGAGCDLLHFPHWNVPVLVRTSYVLTVHDLLLLEHASRRASFLGPVRYAVKYLGYRLVLKNAICRAKRIIAPSNFTAGQLKHFFCAENRTAVVYEGLSHLPAADSAAVSKLAAAGFYLLYVGNAYPHKNLDFLIGVVKKMRARGEDIKLLLVGEDDFYKNLKEKHAGSEAIVFWGRASDEELSALYAGARAYVFPSLSEGFGLPGLEAMSCGVPVVAAKSGALPEIYGEAALYFDPRDEENLEAVLDRVIKDRSKREELIAKGRTAISRFSWDQAAKETLEIYKQAICDQK